MSLPINIEQLLSANKVESNRIEFKAGWNPDAIYRTVCAFANDFDNIGGGYIVIGVEEDNGVAKRPIKGIPDEKLDEIQNEILRYNHLIEPAFFPKISIEDIDNVKIIVMWVMGGASRPYKAPEYITHKTKTYRYYIRYNSSTIVPKGEMEQELISLSNQTPFDDRGNRSATYADISKILLYDYLVSIKSRLAINLENHSIEDILKQMDLLVGSPEKFYVKNVGVMMFCEQPFRFFPYMQVDIVVFPEGKIANPGKMIEVAPIVGPVHIIIKQVLTYLRTNVLKEQIIKVKNKAEAIRCYNYPFEALEEAVVNALFHRDYQIQEPVEITIEPNKIEIINYGGPHRSIKYQDIKAGQIFRARRYRNRRLGEFLKELDLTEGRSTGIPTIQSVLT
jgi:ATP-dependent DNA helicase RecG